MKSPKRPKTYIPTVSPPPGFKPVRTESFGIGKHILGISGPIVGTGRFITSPSTFKTSRTQTNPKKPNSGNSQNARLSPQISTIKTKINNHGENKEKLRSISRFYGNSKKKAYKEQDTITEKQRISLLNYSKKINNLQRSLNSTLISQLKAREKPNLSNSNKKTLAQIKELREKHQQNHNKFTSDLDKLQSQINSLSELEKYVDNKIFAIRLEEGNVHQREL